MSKLTQRMRAWESAEPHDREQLINEIADLEQQCRSATEELATIRIRAEAAMLAIMECNKNHTHSAYLKANAMLERWQEVFQPPQDAEE